MGHAPDITPQVSQSAELTPELQSLIRMELAEKFASVLNPSNTGISKLRRKDQELFIMCMALRMTEAESLVAVNRQRKEDGLPADIIVQNFVYYRKKYQSLIDEVYSVAVLRIGEIYSLADKLVRVARYNELGRLFYENLKPEVRSGIITDSTIKKTNTFIKLMERMNVEMGGRTLNESIIINRPDRPENPIVNKDEVKQIFKDKLNEKYSAQLPVLPTKVQEVSDYVDCAFGENIGGSLIVCWNNYITQSNCGSPCKIQAGEGDICQRFLNRSKLTDKEWVEARLKEKATPNTFALLARGVPIGTHSNTVIGGTNNVDNESKEKVISILVEQGFIFAPEEKITNEENK